MTRMKRCIGTLALALAATAAFAQASFTIVRPADNSKVREKVRFLIPKESIPSRGYVGVYLGDKFLEATVPPVEGKYYVYTLDTKGRGIADTAPGQPIKFELVLFVDYNDGPRIVDRTSVNVNIANKANYVVPNSGKYLRYKFKPGAEWIYRIDQRSTVSTISEQQNSLGGKPATFPTDAESFRLKYAVDNAYGNGDGLVRLQPMPLKGKDYAELTPTGSSTPQKYDTDEMANLYMRLTSTGKQLWGSVPPYVPLDSVGTSGASTTNLYAIFPLPSLPDGPVRPGDTWPARFQNGKIDLEKLNTTDTLVSTFPARGEFIGVEWEMGHRCAKLKNSITTATESVESKKLKAKKAAFTSDDKVSLSETIWFDIDSGRIIKIIRDVTVDTKTANQTLGGGYGNSGMSGTGMPGGVPGMGGYPGMSGRGGYPGMGSVGGMGGGNDKIDQHSSLRQIRGQGGIPGMGMPGMGGVPGMGGYPGMTGRGGQGYPGSGSGYPGGLPGVGRGTSGNGLGTQSSATYTRTRTQLIFTIEK